MQQDKEDNKEIAEIEDAIPANVNDILYEILERGIARLTEKRSKDYRLNLFEGMQVSEIAQSLNLGYKAAENRLTLARKEIRDYMKKELAS